MAIMLECSTISSVFYHSIYIVWVPQTAYHIFISHFFITFYFATSCWIRIPTFILQCVTARAIFLLLFSWFLFLLCYVCVHFDMSCFLLCDKVKKHSLYMHVFVPEKFFCTLQSGEKCTQISLLKYLTISCDRFALNAAADSDDCKECSLITNDHVATVMACPATI